MTNISLKTRVTTKCLHVFHGGWRASRGISYEGFFKFIVPELLICDICCYVFLITLDSAALCHTNKTILTSKHYFFRTLKIVSGVTNPNALW
jgi:hypothetical protein